MADFGDVSTWGEKVDQFLANEAVVPKEKPAELLEFQENLRRQRLKMLLDNLEPGWLEQGSVDWIRKNITKEKGRASFSVGSPSPEQLKNIEAWEKATGLNYEDLSFTSKKRVIGGYGDKVGGQALIKKFETSKEGQKLIKEFEERTGRVYAEESGSLRKTVRDKTFKFSKKLPKDDPGRFKKIGDFIKSTEKTYGFKPSFQEIVDHFDALEGIKYDAAIRNYLEKTNTKLPYGKQFGGSATQVNNRIKKLLNSKTVKNILDEGRFPSNSVIKNILKVDPTTAGSTGFELAKTLTGDRTIRYFKVPTKYKKIAENRIREDSSDFFKRAGKQERGYYERGLTKLMELPKNIRNIRRDIVNKVSKIIPELKGLVSVDEIGSITSSMRRGSGPYAIFAQVLDKDFNSMKGNTIDAQKGVMEKKLVELAVDDPERLKLQKDYNNKVDLFEEAANKNNPIKKVKGLKLSFKPPSETIKNKKVYNQNKKLFDDHFKEFGYSFEVPADRDSIVDISEKLDDKAFQKTVKNRFSKLIGKGGKIGALAGVGTLAGTGWALAEEKISDQVEEGDSLLPEIGAGAAATGAAYKFREPLWKALKKVGSAAFSPAGAVGIWGATGGFDPSSGMDRAGLGAELAFSKDLVRGSQYATKGIKNTALRNLTRGFLNAGMPLKMALRFTRVATPLGWASLGVEGAYQLGKAIINERERVANLSEEERSAERAQQEEADQLASEIQGAAEGGLMSVRQGFANGSDDPDKNKKVDKGRRKFLKGMGIFAALPIVGKYIDVFQPLVQQHGDAIVKTVAEAPTHFRNLYLKILAKGIDAPEITTIEREIGKTYKDYSMTHSLDTGTVTIKKHTQGGGTYQLPDGEYDTWDGVVSEEVMEFVPKAEDIDLKTGKRIEYPSSYEEVTVRPSYPDGEMDDVSEGLDNLQEIIEEGQKID